jgi:hypothetical protein
MDAALTTAVWDTVAGEIRMYPFQDSVRATSTAATAPTQVVLDDIYAFVADLAYGVRIFDVSDPDNPTLAGGCAMGVGTINIAVDGDIAYVMNGTSLCLVDITDVASPSLLGCSAALGPGRDVIVDGDYAYVAAVDSVHIVDVSMPATPTQVGAVYTGVATSVFLSGTVLYVADGSAGLIALDVSDRTAPVILDTYATPGNAYDVVVWGNYAYVADGTGGVLVVNVTDPSSLSLGGSYAASGDVRSVDVGGNFAVYTNGAGVGVLDISDPTAPVLDGTIAIAAVNGIDLYGEFAYAVGGTGLHILDLFDHAYPAVLGTPSVPNASRAVVDGDIVYVVDDTRALLAYDITDPSSASLLGSTLLESNNVNRAGLDIRGDLAYVASESLYVVDISDPTAPVVIGTDRIAQGGYDVEVKGDYAFIAGEYFRVDDISDPTSPTAVQAGPPVAGPWGSSVEVVGDYAWAVGAAIYIYDISDPTALSIPFSAPGGDYRSVAVRGNHAYLVSALKFQVLDVTDPIVPWTGVDVLVPGVDAALCGNYALLASSGALFMYDITNPDSSVPATSFNADLENPRAVSAAHDFATVSSHGSLRFIRTLERWVDASRLLAVSDTMDTNGPAVAFRVNTTTSNPSAFFSIVTPLDTVAATEAAWVSLNNPTSLFTWHANLQGSDEGLIPTVTQLDVDWLFEHSLIDSIVDVPGDQGGWAYLYFTRSGYDFASVTTTPITAYNIHRRADSALPASTIMSEGRFDTDTRLFEYKEEKYRINKNLSSGPPGVWSVVATVFAQQKGQYIALVPTLGDSTAIIPFTDFYISAHTTTPSIFYDSPVDSGYSFDNIAPSPPMNLTAAYNTGSGNQLAWDPSPDEDFQFFRVYRDTDPDFVPGPANEVHVTTSTGWSDPGYDGGGIYYKVTAIDYVGNESDPSSPGTVTSVPETRFPKWFALHPNAPNPFNPMTTIRYDVPAGGGEVMLRIYDVRGRLVRTLVDGMQSPGEKRTVWYGRDNQGNSVATGMYFYRMTAPGFEMTKKMVLLQ